MADHQFLNVPSKSFMRKPPEQAAPVSDDANLQNVIGNQAMQRLLSNTPAKPSMFIQAKLTVGAANDQYEAEADTVADKVMKMPDKVQREGEDELQAKRVDIQRAGEEDELAAKRADIQREGDEEDVAMKRDFSNIQRAEEDELAAKRDFSNIQRAEEDELAAKRDFGAIQRAEEDELAAKRDFGAIQRAEEDELAAKRDFSAIQRAGEEDELAAKRMDIQRAEVDMMGSFDVDAGVEKQISGMKGGGQALPESARDFFEPRFGQDFSDVRVHTGGESDKVNREISARAFTNGNDIFLRNNEYNPDSNDGRTLLAHELTHVVQQTGGKAQAKREEKS